MSKYLCLLFVFLELSFLSIWSKGFVGWQWVPAFQFCAGLLVVLYAYLSFRQQKEVVDKDPLIRYPIEKWEVGILALVSGVAWYCVVIKLNYYFERFPVNPTVSDILPLLEVYVQRFLDGEAVYRDISMGSYTIYPNWFPLFWMPFTISELGDFDYRWVAFASYFLATITYGVYSLYYCSHFLERLFKILLPIGALWMFLISRDTMFGNTVELLIVGFYLFLLFVMMRQYFWLSILMLVVCLLSRYVIVLAIPLVVAVHWKAEGSKRTIRMAAMVALLGFLIFGPFLRHNWKIPITSYRTYQEMIEVRWTEMDQLTTNNTISAGSAILTHSYGLAYYFYQLSSGDGIQKMKVFGQIQKWSLLLFVLFAAGWYWWRRPQMDYRLYLLLCLKIYFLLFYALIQVPWPYLFLLPGMINLSLLWEIRFSGRENYIRSVNLPA